MSCDFGGTTKERMRGREREREKERERERGKEKERKRKNNAHEVIYDLFINSCQS